MRKYLNEQTLVAFDDDRLHIQVYRSYTLPFLGGKMVYLVDRAL